MTACAALGLMLLTPKSHAANFFLSPGVDPNGDLAWQGAVGPFTEFDLENFACDSIQQSLTDGSTTITIGPGATGQRIFCGGYAGGGGVVGTVQGGALLNQDGSGTKTANLTFTFDQPVKGFGLWVFDDTGASADSVTMTVTEVGGAMTTSDVLDSDPGVGSHAVEGFIGVTSSVGITTVTIDPANNVFFEVDHIQVGEAVPESNHFACYEVEDRTELDPKPVVSLEDMFSIDVGVKVRKAKIFCNPVDKNGEGIADSENRLTCYKAKSRQRKRTVEIENQFGTQTLVIDDGKILCVPSAQLAIAEGDLLNDDDDDDDHDKDDD